MRLYNLFRMQFFAACLLWGAHWGGPALANDWDISYRQNQDIAVQLETEANTSSEDACPEHFNLVRLSTEFDLAQMGTINITRVLPEISRAGTRDKSDTSYVDQNAVLNMQVDMTGCAFRRHFLPQTGHFVISGEFKIGSIENAQLSHDPTANYNIGGRSYEARLAGPAEGFDRNGVVQISNLSQDQVIGTLGLNLNFVEVPLISDARADQTAKFRRFSLKILLRSQ